MSYNYQYIKNKRLALKRDSLTCQHCGSKKNLQTHHLIPLNADGTHDLINLITLCHSCHRYVERINNEYLERTNCKKFMLSLGPNIYQKCVEITEKENITIQQVVRDACSFWIKETMRD